MSIGVPSLLLVAWVGVRKCQNKAAQQNETIAKRPRAANRNDLGMPNCPSFDQSSLFVHLDRRAVTCRAEFCRAKASFTVNRPAEVRAHWLASLLLRACPLGTSVAKLKKFLKSRSTFKTTCTWENTLSVWVSVHPIVIFYSMISIVYGTTHNFGGEGRR